MLQVKLTTIDDSVGVVLPKEIREKLNVSEGDSLYLLERSEGFILTRHQRDVDEQMYAAKKVLNKYCSAFSELAK